MVLGEGDGGEVNGDEQRAEAGTGANGAIGRA
jgi:hypothetical protein